MGCLRGRVLPDFRSRSCFCLNSYRSCDTCLWVGRNGCLSQVCSEQGKAHISIAAFSHVISPCRYSKRHSKVVTCFRRISAGLGNIFRPWRGHIYSRKATKIEEDERDFDRWAETNGTPKGAPSQKKRVLPQRVFFALSRKDIQKDFTKIYEMLEFCYSVWWIFQISVSRERHHWKEPSKYFETWELKHAESCWGKNFSKANTWKERIKMGQAGKEQKSKDWCSFIRWFICK